jgi:hypothetical protein
VRDESLESVCNLATEVSTGKEPRVNTPFRILGSFIREKPKKGVLGYDTPMNIFVKSPHS